MPLRTYLLFYIILGYLCPLIGQETDFDFVITTDGAWTWFNDERAIIDHDRLYVSYVGADGRVGMSVWDLQDDKAVGIPFSLSSWREADDHNNASLISRKDGKIMAFYAKHHTEEKTYHRTSLIDQPNSESDWGPEVEIKSGAKHTYNNAFQLSELNGTIFNFSRINGYNPNWKQYDSTGVAMTINSEYIRSGDDKTRPYVKYASNGKDRIDFFFTNGHPRKTDNNLYHMYFKGGAFYQTDGLLIKTDHELPISVDEVDKFYTFGDLSPTARPWTSSFNYDDAGNPVVTYSLQEDENNIDYYYAYYAPELGSWLHYRVADAGDALYDAEKDYTGLLVINPYDTREVFMSANINPLNDQVTPHYELYRGFTPDGGANWKWAAITENSVVDNLRPFVPKGSSAGSQVVLWLRGSYRTYTDYSTQVVGKYITSSKTYPNTKTGWAFEQANLWQSAAGTLKLLKAGRFTEDIRRPSALACLEEEIEGDFSLRAEVRCTESVDNKGRDVILVFGYQSPRHFYYAHLSNDNTIMPHNGIFIVDGADRRRIDTPGLKMPPECRMNDQNWHQVAIQRNSTTGEINVYVDDLNTPLMRAKDQTFIKGKIGFGSFDNTGEVRQLELIRPNAIIE